MADELLSPLQRVQAMFGVRNDGATYQTKRALLEAGEGTPATAEPVVEPLPDLSGLVRRNEPQGNFRSPLGPAPSSELLERVRKQQELRGAESLKRITEQRDRQPAPEPDVPPTGGIYR